MTDRDKVDREARPGRGPPIGGHRVGCWVLACARSAVFLEPRPSREPVLGYALAGQDQFGTCVKIAQHMEMPVAGQPLVHSYAFLS